MGSNGSEFCQILNASLRPGSSQESLKQGAILCRCINQNLLNSRTCTETRPFPHSGLCVRGGGLPDEHLSFFTQGKTFRFPNYFATAFENEHVPYAKDDPDHPHKDFL